MRGPTSALPYAVRTGARKPASTYTLFVTIKTVEMHLTSSYRKLDITSRTELPVAMERTTPS